MQEVIGFDSQMDCGSDGFVHDSCKSQCGYAQMGGF